MDANAKNRRGDPRCCDGRRRGFNTRVLKIGEKAARLRDLGTSDKAIAPALDVSDRTVSKAIRSTYHSP